MVGAFHVLLGSAAGITTIGNQLWLQDDLDLTDGSKYEDLFGRSLAAGDFDGDGYDDLGFSLWGQDLFVIRDAGEVRTI